MAETTLSKAIERVIRRGTGAKTIGEVELLLPVWGGNGEVLRVELDDAQVDAVIVKRVLNPADSKRKKKKIKDESLARTLLSYDNELAFYQRYAAQLPVRTPHFYSGLKLEDGWVFILEDLSEAGFLAAKKGYTDGAVRGALKWLAGFHGTFMGHTGEGLWKPGSYWNLAARAEERSKMVDPRLKQMAGALDQALNSCTYKTLIHGDAKTDNFCFHQTEEGKVAGLDFQYVGLGCGMKDVMCLLDSCVDPHEAVALAPGYLDFYFEELTQVVQSAAALQSAGARIDPREVEREWRQLYPVAWADYYRFLDGWTPGKYPPEGHAREMLEQAIAYLARA